jgi:hypothetical protein
MKPLAIKKRFIPRGKVSIPGDKSIAHRALIISALSRGRTAIKNFPVHDDSLATINVLSGLGVEIRRKDNQVIVRGTGKLKEPKRALFVDNSGTTLRLMAGVLAGSGFRAKLTAGKYLSKRPMSRVNIPLRRWAPGYPPEEWARGIRAAGDRGRMFARDNLSAAGSLGPGKIRGTPGRFIRCRQDPGDRKSRHARSYRKDA